MSYFYPTTMSPFSSKAPIFPRFKELPPELQLLVWEFAIPDPRNITYSKNYISWHDWHHKRNIYLHSLTYVNPGILGACYDSRAEALKRYKPALGIELGHPIYLDFARDTFEFGDFASLEALSIKNTPFAGSKGECDLIKTVGITLDRPFNERSFMLLCSNFGGMETLMVRERGWWKLETEPLSEFNGLEIERSWPWITREIRRCIEGRGGKRGAWRPPTVIRGTEEQWDRILKEKERERGKDMVDEMEWEPIQKGHVKTLS